MERRLNLWCVVVMVFAFSSTGCSLSLKITAQLARLIAPTPQANLSSTTAANNNLSQWSIDVEFNTPVQGLDISDFDLTNGVVTDLQEISEGTIYRILVNPIAEGNVSVQLRADAVLSSRNEKNPSSNILSFINDQTKPSAVISYLGIDPTNTSPLHFSVTFSEPMIGQIAISDFAVTGGSLSQISGNGTVFYLEVVPSASGTVSISLSAGRMTDLFGNENLISNSVSVIFDNDRPLSTLSSVAGDDVNSAITVNVSFSAAVGGFSAGDLEVENALISNFSGSGASYSFTLTPISEGNFRVRVVENAAQDSASNQSLASSWLQKNYDSIVPTVTLSTLALYTTTTSPVVVTATFSESITGFDVSDLTLVNTTAAISGSGTTYTITLTPQGEGVFSVKIPAAAITDSAGNPVQASSTVSSIRDTTLPTATVTSDIGPYSYSSPMSFTVVFSEPVTDLTLSDFNVVGGTNAQLSTLMGFGTIWTFQMSPSVTGTKTITLPANKVIDAAGLANVVSNTETFIYDTTPVYVSFVQREQAVLESSTMPQKFQIRMAGTKPYPVTINYRLIGSAVNGVDHDLATEGNITIPANSANPTTVDIPFNLVHNPSIENKYIQMNLHYTSSPLIRFGKDYQSRIAIADMDGLHGSVVSLSVSDLSRCVVLSDGRLRCWGNNSSNGVLGDGTTAASLTAKNIDIGRSYAKVVASSVDTCGILGNGDLYCWGNNFYKQLANTSTTSYLSPIYVDSGYSDVAILGKAICGIKSGDIYCWGTSAAAELGNGLLTGVVTSPTNITSNTTTYPNSFVSVSASGGAYACALDSAGDVYCWGYNNVGQLGDGTTNTALVPTKLISAVAFKSISAGGSHVCAIDINDALKCWGYNTNGQVGDGTVVTRMNPVAVDAANTYLNVAAGASHTCAVRKVSQRVVCWGRNITGSFDAGALGDGSDYSTVYKTTPTLVTDTATYAVLSAGYNFSCGVTTDQRVKCWGSYANNGVGDGFESNRAPLVDTDYGQGYKQVDVNTSFGCGIDDQDRLKCWGNGTAGSVGDGMNGVVRSSPVVLDRGLTYKFVSVGRRHACAIMIDGTLKCWGNNSDGVVGAGNSASVFVTPVVVDGGTKYRKVAAGSSMTCGITEDGVLKCWGWHYNGQLGDGTAISKSYPAIIDSGVKYIDIAVSRWGESHTCGITETKNLKCWGGNSNSQLGLGGTTPANYTTPQVVSATDLYSSVAVGFGYTCATRDGANSLYCWGISSDYQTGSNSTSLLLTPALVDSSAYSALVLAQYGGCGKTAVGYKCWGGVSSTLSRLVGVTALKIPTLIPNAANYKELSFSNPTVMFGVAAGCAIKLDSGLQCTGPNDSGLLAHAGVFPGWLSPVDVTTWVVQ
ncbi:Ig-like domain-containing protein [Bdellovibrio sp. HCB290]|uniref:Ig-like domain-containing protein n=1 Tax=Bdellovibrio sp. HCB290 TaxID=3394356 RepID=UPI0039B55D2F